MTATSNSYMLSCVLTLELSTEWTNRCGPVVTCRVFDETNKIVGTWDNLIWGRFDHDDHFTWKKKDVSSLMQEVLTFCQATCPDNLVNFYMVTMRSLPLELRPKVLATLRSNGISTDHGNMKPF